MIGDRSVAEQSCEKSQSVIGQRGIDEWFLPFKSFGRAAARLVISVELGSDNFREEL